MKNTRKVLSIDIGASSGRLFVTTYDGERFTHEETYRFQNGMIEKDGHLYWDYDEILNHILKGLEITMRSHRDISTLGVDTWAVDYGRLDEEGHLIDLPFGYRDSRNQSSMQNLLSKTEYGEIYQESGIQKIDFNTIFQLHDDLRSKRAFSEFLFIPDLIVYDLTGEKRCELTNLSTSCLYDPRKRCLSQKMLDLIGLDKRSIAPIIPPSTKVGHLKKEWIEKCHLYDLEVVSVGSHDTASAVAAADINETRAYLASGTWSLLGVELDRPIITEESYARNFTNEIGLDHSVRFLKNIMGLFILQEIRNDLRSSGKEFSFQEIADLASEVRDNEIYIDVEDELFQKPGDMLKKYLSYIKKTEQDQNEITLPVVFRSIYESMAFKYIKEFEALKKLTGKALDSLCVIGGGNKASLLNQMIADCLSIEVISGKSEATVCGNALAQLIYLGEFKDHQEARAKLVNQTEKEIYLPKDVDLYREKYRRYLEVIQRGRRLA